MLDIKITSTDDHPHLKRNYVKRVYGSALADYYVYRNLFLNDDILFLNEKLVKMAGDCVEKLLKTFLLSHDYTRDLKKEIGHELHKLKEACVLLNPYFDNPKLSKFCKEYGSKHKRYRGHTMFGYSDFPISYEIYADFSEILDLLDDINFQLELMWGKFLPREYDLFYLYLDISKLHEWNLKLFKDKQRIYLTKNSQVERIYKANQKEIDTCIHHRIASINYPNRAGL